MIDWCCIALGAHIATYHFDRSRDLNEFNPGIYARADRWQAGMYRNSLRKPSWYVSYAFPLTDRLALSVGGVTGYRHVGTIAPAVVLTYRFDSGITLAGFPSTPKSTGGVHAAYEIIQGERK